MAKVAPKATLLSVEDAGPPPEPEKEMSAGELQIAEFIRKVHAERAEAEKVPPPPPPRTERQQSILEAEMEAGRKALEKHAAAAEAQRGVKLVREKDPPTNTPIFRPEDYVPKFGQGKTADVTARSTNV